MRKGNLERTNTTLVSAKYMWFGFLDSYIFLISEYLSFVWMICSIRPFCLFEEKKKEGEDTWNCSCTSFSFYFLGWEVRIKPLTCKLFRGHKYLSRLFKKKLCQTNLFFFTWHSKRCCFLAINGIYSFHDLKKILLTLTHQPFRTAWKKLRFNLGKGNDLQLYIHTQRMLVNLNSCLNYVELQSFYAVWKHESICL